MTQDDSLSEDVKPAEQLGQPIYRTKPRIGLALGGGGGRGWAHIGVLSRLLERGLKPDIITGTSMGAVVAGCYAAGCFQSLKDWACGLTTFRMLRYLDFRLTGGGMIGGDRLVQELTQNIGDTHIEDLPTKFGAIATDLHTGQEVWIRKGPLVDSIHASFAIPGVFKPVTWGDTLLVDGGLVNPVPINLARSLGADVVIAVSLAVDMRSKYRHPSGLTEEKAAPSHMSNSIKDIAERRIESLIRPTLETPSALNTLLTAGNVMQERISRIRMAGNPPDVLIGPRVGHVGFLEFDRAAELIEIGAAAVDRAAHAIEDALALELDS